MARQRPVRRPLEPTQEQAVTGAGVDTQGGKEANEGAGDERVGSGGRGSWGRGGRGRGAGARDGGRGRHAGGRGEGTQPVGDTDVGRPNRIRRKPARFTSSDADTEVDEASSMDASSDEQ